MTIHLYGSWFSPFARKVALALELKRLPYEHTDALLREFRDRLRQVNARVEVPVLIDGDITVVNSSDILQYLEQRYPQTPIYPADIAERVTARALERTADERFDPIIVDCSFWHWADRCDTAPEGLHQAAQRDLDDIIFPRLEAELAARPQPWPFGAPGVVECSWFANLIAARPMGFTLDAERFPTVDGWLRAMRAHPVFAADAKRAAAFFKNLKTSSHERQKIFWSGQRLEWLLSRGFHPWFAKELEAGRATFPD